MVRVGRGGVAGLGQAIACLAVACLAVACGKAEPVARAGTDVTGTLSVDGAQAQLVRCRPGHAVNVFVEVDTTLGTLRFGDGKLSWQGSEQACQKLDRRWGGGVRRDGTAYFRGTLSFRCGKITGDLALDCGQISPREAAELDRNRAAAAAKKPSPNPSGNLPDDAGTTGVPPGASADSSGTSGNSPETPGSASASPGSSASSPGP